MLKTFMPAAVAVTTAMTAAAALAQVNLTSHTAGAGTAVGLTRPPWSNMRTIAASPTFS